jgi:low affinity Fe/Cu permease
MQLEQPGAKRPHSQQLRNFAYGMRRSFFATFEAACERITYFVSGHWGTLTAVLLVAVGTLVFLWDGGESFATKFEHFLTMLSFALLFLLQRSETKDTLSLQVKLNELLRVACLSDNRVINIERQSEDELKEIHERYQALHDKKAAGTNTPIGSDTID